jgi:FixJ family two-component response regulator
MEEQASQRLDLHRAFVIDDDASIQHLVTELLAGKDFRTEAFTSAKTALAALGSDRPAIIFLDVAYCIPMPSMCSSVWEEKTTTAS